MQIQKLTPVSGIKRALKQYNKISERQIANQCNFYILFWTHCFGLVSDCNRRRVLEIV